MCLASGSPPGLALPAVHCAFSTMFDRDAALPQPFFIAAAAPALSPRRHVRPSSLIRVRLYSLIDSRPSFTTFVSLFQRQSERRAGT